MWAIPVARGSAECRRTSLGVTSAAASVAGMTIVGATSVAIVSEVDSRGIAAKPAPTGRVEPSVGATSVAIVSGMDARNIAAKAAPTERAGAGIAAKAAPTTPLGATSVATTPSRFAAASAVIAQRLRA
jgi:hypothetical protein